MKKNRFSRRSFISNTSLVLASTVASSLSGTGYAAAVDNIKRMVKIKYPWEHPIVPSLSSAMQNNLWNARNFSEIIHGAALIYNLLLANSSSNDELIDYYKEEMNNWEKGIDVRWNELNRWYSEIDGFWNSDPLLHSRIPIMTRSFVNQWLKMIFKTVGLNNVIGNKSVNDLISYRERQLKGNRARLHNPRALEMWSGASGNRQLDYRWGNVSRILGDILSGLKRKDDDAES